MKEIINMLLVLTAICGVCGLLLAGVKAFTNDRIEEQELIYVKGPAVQMVLAGSTNDPIKDRVEVDAEDGKRIVFVGKKDGKPWAVAYETTGKGFGGNIGVITGFDLAKQTLTGIGITTHKETPGLGSRVGEESFSNKFKNRALTDVLKVAGDGGVIDAVTGATYSSKGVCEAVGKGVSLFGGIKTKVTQ